MAKEQPAATAMASSAAVVVGSPTHNDKSGHINTGLKDDDSFTVVDSLGSSYLARYNDMNDDDSLSSTSSSDSSSSEADEKDSLLSSSSSSSSDSDGSSSSDEDDNHYPVNTPLKSTCDSSSSSSSINNRKVTPSPKQKSLHKIRQTATPSIAAAATQKHNTCSQKNTKIYNQQQSNDLQLLSTIIKSKATRPTEISWQTRSSIHINPRERFDDLCHEYIADDGEDDWDLPLWELAKVVEGRLKDRADENYRRKGKEESSSSSDSSSSSSSSSPSSSDSIVSSSSSSSSSSEEENNDFHHHNEDDNSLNQVDFNVSHDNHSSVREKSPMSYPSSPLGSVVIQVESADVGKPKIVVDNDDGETAALSLIEATTAIAASSLMEEARGNEVFSPTNNKRKLSPEEVQPTFSMALDPNASSHHDDGSFTQVDFHGSFGEDASMTSPSSHVLVHLETAEDGTQKIPFAVDDSNGTTEAAAAMMEARGKDVLLSSHGKRKLSQEEIQPTPSEVVVVVAAAKEGEIASSSSMDMKGMTSSSFTSRAKRKLFQEEEQLSPPIEGSSNGVTGRSISRLAVMAANAALKKKKVVEEKESPNDANISSSTKVIQPPRKRRSAKTATKRTRKICSIESCTSQARNGGLCQRHGAKVSLCTFDGCSNQVINGGVCIRHGAQVAPKIKGPRLRCSVETCTNFAKKGGVCIRHGATQQRKRCVLKDAVSKRSRVDCA
eukprot:scaffold5026_cov215-Skeletonema_marinoi.AAC.3